ncbi:MAG: hypothetical protein AB7G75_00135 [Candidatus Binatia bacterium]
MRVVPRRSTAALILTVLLTFLTGPLLGLFLAYTLAPDSNVAEILSFLGFSAILIVGMYAWLGVAVLILIPRLLRRLVFRGSTSAPDAVLSDQRELPPGALAFVIVGSLAGLAVGVPIGFFLSTLPFLLVVTIYWVTGTLFGAGLWLLARTGLLPFPEEG